jgi:hypothetical protein
MTEQGGSIELGNGKGRDRKGVKVDDDGGLVERTQVLRDGTGEPNSHNRHFAQFPPLVSLPGRDYE